MRLDSGFELSIGLYVFDVVSARDAYTLPIDLSTPGSESLTVDDVTTTTVQSAGFIMLGINTDLL